MLRRLQKTFLDMVGEALLASECGVSTSGRRERARLGAAPKWKKRMEEWKDDRTMGRTEGRTDRCA